MTFAQPFTDYEILDRVGAGAMGTVFKARHKKLNRIVALKVLKPSLARDSRYVERLRREARIVASLNHRNIVTGYDLGEEGGYHFFVMEFVEGKSLRGLLSEWGVFSEEYVLEVGEQIAEALDHAYQRGVIHRDVKPGNVLIDEQGKVKLTDMGLAKGPADMTLTRDGATVGTPQYISPEQARNPQDVDVRTDLYSLGATLYHMATGVPPFTGDTMAELITKVIYEPPVPPNELNPALSEGFSLVVRKLLAKDLRVRYQTPRELLDDIARVQKALPPEVDPERLAAGEGERRVAVGLRALVVCLVLAALGGAVWLGMQLRQSEQAVAEGDPFLGELDRILLDMPTPGQRWQHLRTLRSAPPPGAELAMMQRESLALGELQKAVDAAVGAFTGSGWSELTAWLRSPSEWPDRQRWEVERLMHVIRQATGMLPSQLPPNLDTARLDELRRAVDTELAARDAGLLLVLDAYLATTLPELVDERLRAYDYVGAGKLWHGAMTSFCKRVGMLSSERLAEATARQIRERCDQEERLAGPAIDAAEARVADAMHQEVSTVVRYLGEQMGEGAEADEVGAAIARLRQDLLQVWPASSRFRPERDPWPDIERMVGEMRHRAALASAAADGRRFERRCDLAWRSLCHGDAQDALLILEDLAPPTENHAARLAEHRRALRAAGAVTERLLHAIASAPPHLMAFPRTSHVAVELRVETESGQLLLYSQGVGEMARRAVLTEFRFGELLASIRRFAGDPLADLPRDEAVRGQAVLRLVGDDLAGFGALVRTIEDVFLVDDVAPRVQRVRNEQDETVLDRSGLLRRMQEALVRARAGGPLRELENAIRSFDWGIGDNDRSDRERRELRIARDWYKLARRRVDVRGDIESVAPQGADITVDIDDEQSEIAAAVTMPASLLLRSTAGAWQMREGMLEFAGGDQPWSELGKQKLECDTGFPLTGPRRNRSTLHLDLALPPASVGRRFYVVEFRGIAVMLVLTANDGVHAALLEGDPHREEHADRAFDLAIRGVLGPQTATAVPGAWHRLTIDILASSGRNQAAVKVLFEGHELLDTPHKLDPEHAVSVVLYPRQEMAVRQIRVTGSGL